MLDAGYKIDIIKSFGDKPMLVHFGNKTPRQMPTLQHNSTILILMVLSIKMNVCYSPKNGSLLPLKKNNMIN